MGGWTVHLEAAGRPGDVDDDLIVDLAGALGGSATGAQDGSRYGATISISAVDPVHACSEAMHAFDTARAAVGLPDLPIVRAEVLTDEELDLELERPAFPELVGINELAKLAGVTSQRASALAHRPGFPEPLARLAAGPVWPRPWVDRFLQQWSRAPGRPRSVGGAAKPS